VTRAGGPAVRALPAVCPAGSVRDAPPMPWLLRDGEVLAAVEEARTAVARGRGLLGRDHEGVLLLEAWSIHTIGMRRDIDVAFCRACSVGPRHRRPDGVLELEVVGVRTLRPRRVSRPRRRGRFVLEAAAGSFASWGVAPGERLVVR